MVGIAGARLAESGDDECESEGAAHHEVVERLNRQSELLVALTAEVRALNAKARVIEALLANLELGGGGSRRV